MGFYHTSTAKVQRKHLHITIGANAVRLIIPNSKKMSGVVRVFVKTGPAYGGNVISNHNVGADLLLPG